MTKEKSKPCFGTCSTQSRHNEISSPRICSRAIPNAKSQLITLISTGSAFVRASSGNTKLILAQHLSLDGVDFRKGSVHSKKLLSFHRPPSHLTRAGCIHTHIPCVCVCVRRCWLFPCTGCEFAGREMSFCHFAPASAWRIRRTQLLRFTTAAAKM